MAEHIHKLPCRDACPFVETPEQRRPCGSMMGRSDICDQNQKNESERIGYENACMDPIMEAFGERVFIYNDNGKPFLGIFSTKGDLIGIIYDGYGAVIDKK